MEVHVYDDIEEEDNHLPNWWMFILISTMIFSFGYWFVYHTLKVMPNPPTVYADDVKQFKIEHPPVVSSDDQLIAISKDPAVVEEGKKVFVSTCAACHGPYGQGIIGPNLTDKYWLHGNKPSEIANTVTNGYAEKGMPAWGKTLGDEKVRKVVAYVLTLKNSTLPADVKPKDPQGDLLE